MSSTTPGQRLRMGRERQRKSRRDIAEAVHRSESTVKSWELDQTRPRSFRDIAAVCQACGITIDEYISGIPPAGALTPEQKRLLKAFDRHQAINQQAILEFFEALEL